MAERRMMSMKIVNSDAFLDMPLTTQALYFHLVMRADDDGFINSPKRVARTVGASENDLRELADKRFVLTFPCGVLVIKHWRMMNSVKNDRIKLPLYPELAADLYIKQNGAYTDRQGIDTKNLLEVKTLAVDSNRIPDGIPEEVRRKEVNVSIEEEEGDNDCLRKLGRYKNVMLSENQVADLLEKMDVEAFDHYLLKLSTYMAENDKQIKNHYRTMLKWFKEDSRIEK